jgi:hypothetical protein
VGGGDVDSTHRRMLIEGKLGINRSGVSTPVRTIIAGHRRGSKMHSKFLNNVLTNLPYRQIGVKSYQL